MLAALSRSCKLDKAIVVSICKHVAASGTFVLSTEDIWARLGDFERALGLHVDISVPFSLPPISDFCERLSLLSERGILSKVSLKNGCYGVVTYSLPLYITDVALALKDDMFYGLIPGCNTSR